MSSLEIRKKVAFWKPQGGGEDVPEKRNSISMLSDPINLDEKNIFFKYQKYIYSLPASFGKHFTVFICRYFDCLAENINWQDGHCNECMPLHLRK
jgi:hypothetical protein